MSKIGDETTDGIYMEVAYIRGDRLQSQFEDRGKSASSLWL